MRQAIAVSVIAMSLVLGADARAEGNASLAQPGGAERPAGMQASGAASDLEVGDAAVVAGLEGPGARLPLRQGPSRETAAIDRLPNGTGVIIIGVQDPWYRVVTDGGAVGWVRGAFLVTTGTGEVPPPADDMRWTHWTNPRFGMVIDYPAGLFRPEPEPENGDGASFVTPDGLAGFFVYGQWNALDLSLQEMHDMDLGTGVFGRVTEDRITAQEYVLTGEAEGRVTFRRALMPPPGDVLYVFEIGYPAAAAETFGPVVERMAASFGLAGMEDAAEAPASGGEAEDPILQLLTEEIQGLLDRLP